MKAPDTVGRPAMAELPISAPRPMDARYPLHGALPKRRRSGLVVGTIRLLASPASAFLFLFPTIGYYVLASYVNLLLPEGSVGGIIIRAGSLGLLFVAYVGTPARERRRFSRFLLPATIFFLLYIFRLLDNILFLDLQIPPENTFVLLNLFLSCMVPAYMLAALDRAIRDEDMIRLLSVFSVLFVVGMALNREALVTSSEVRATLEKINSISLAYVASSLMLYYLLCFARSKRSTVEALLVVPVLLLIVAIARSRGMLISTGATLVFYVLVIRGTRRIWTLFALGASAAIIGLYANPDYLDRLIESLNRIDVYSDMSTASRFTSFEGAWSQFLDDPIFGRYAFELQTNYYPHNIYLEALMSVGIIGTLPFLMHFGLALRAAFSLIRQPEPSFAGMFIALLFVRDAVGAAASGGLWGVSGFWITSFLLITMWYGRKQDTRLHRRRELRLAHGRDQSRVVRA